LLPIDTFSRIFTKIEEKQDGHFFRKHFGNTLKEMAGMVK
jgi:hypothetical protein